jgi:hypothetical protein
VPGPLSASSAVHDRPRFPGTTARAGNLPTPLRSFLRTETGSAAVLLAAAAAALVCVNVDPRTDDGVWSWRVSTHVGGSNVSLDLRIRHNATPLPEGRGYLSSEEYVV